MSILTTVKSGFFVIKNVIIKNGPKIALGVGTLFVVAGGADACRQTLKAPELIEKHRKKMADIHYAMELADQDEIEYTPAMRRKDTAIAYAGTAVDFAKLYWRPITLVGLGFGSIFGGFGVLNSRHIAALGAFTTTAEQFNDYRSRVIAEYGEEADKKFSGKILETNEIKVKRTLDDGTEKEINVNAVDLSSVTWDTFTYDYNYKVPEWEDGNYLYNDNKINQMIDVFTRELRTNRTDFVKLSDVVRYLKLDQLPCNKSKMAVADFYGWMNKPGAEVKVNCVPYVTVYPADEACDQFPMQVPINVLDDDEFDWFRKQYAEDVTKVGYTLQFDVDKDANGMPDEIYTKIYGDVL